MEISRPQVDIQAMFKKPELALGNFFEARQAMDQINDQAIAEAIKQKSAVSARMKSLEAKCATATMLLGSIDEKAIRGVKGILEFSRANIFDEFPERDLENRMKDSYALEIRHEKENRALSEKRAKYQEMSKDDSMKAEAEAQKKVDEMSMNFLHPVPIGDFELRKPIHF